MRLTSLGGFGLGAVLGLHSLALPGMFPRVTLAPDNEGGGGFVLPDDTPFDAEPAGGGADSGADPAGGAGPEDDDFEDGGEGDDGGDPPPEERQQQQARTPEEIAAENQRLRAALNQARARQRVRERQQGAAGTGGDPAPREQRQEGGAGPEQLIDPDENPIQAMRQMQELIRAYQANEAAAEQSAAERTRQEQQFRAIQETLEEYEADFRVVHPDYGEAIAHLARTRGAELMQFGIPAAELPGLIRQEFARNVAVAIRAGRDPAEAFYQTAQQRGYKPGAAARGAAPAGGGAPAAGGAPAGGKPATPNLDRIRAGQKVSSPLSRGGSRASPIDMATLANIDIRSKRGGEVFDQAWEAMETEAKAAERARGGSRR